MIDTVRCQARGRFRDPPQGWEVYRASKSVEKPGELVDPYESGESILVKHKLSGLRVGFRNDEADWVEASLPRCLWGVNSKLIRNDRMLLDAWAAFESIASEVGVRDVWGATRIDLVWQWDGSMALWTAGLKHTKFKHVRKHVIDYGPTGLVWKGTKMAVRLYDKAAVCKVKGREVVRLEFQLRKEHVERVTDVRSWPSLYSAYWKLCEDLQPGGNRYLPRLKTVAHLIAACEASGVEIDNTSVLDLWLAEHGKTKRNRDEIRRQVREAVGDWAQVDLRDICTDKGFSRFAEIA